MFMCLKKAFNLLMVISMVLVMFTGAASAESAAYTEETPASAAEQDLYIYKYDGTRYVHEGVPQNSSYLVEFRWMNGDSPAERWRDYDISSGLFFKQKMTFFTCIIDNFHRCMV